ncbi:MAG: hypothetical protein GY733_14550, partial [bacterium]|nr:hypothetical protein [bacterium]
NWKSHDAMLVGLPKAIQLAGNYEQLDYQITSGGPSPSTDRGLRVDIAKLDSTARDEHALRDRRLA